MPFDKQTAFNTALNHLRVQGKPAVSSTGQSCRYRTPDGCKCAVGSLIPDDRYDPAMEGHDAEDPGVLAMVGAPPEEGAFLLACQTALHDERYETDFHAALEKAAKEMAAFFGLTVPPQETPAS